MERQLSLLSLAQWMILALGKTIFINPIIMKFSGNLSVMRLA